MARGMAIRADEGIRPSRAMAGRGKLRGLRGVIG